MTSRILRPLGDRSSRPSARTTPTVSEGSRPKGLPTARTRWPTRSVREVPVVRGSNFSGGVLIQRTAPASALQPDEPAGQAAREHDDDRREPARGEDDRGRRGEGGGHPVVHSRAGERVHARGHEADADGRERPLGRERPRPAAEPLPPARDDCGQQRGWQEHGDPRHQGADEAVGAVADEDRDEHIGAGRELREGVAVHELAGGHPPVAPHDLTLHLGEHPEPSAHGDEAEPEKRPRETEEIRHHPFRGRLNHKLTGSTRQTANAVFTPSGPTSRNVATATAVATRPRIEPVTSCAVATSTRPTTVAPIPYMSRVVPGANAPRK